MRWPRPSTTRGATARALVYESGPHGVDYDRHWWVQAEAVVGFYSAYQITGQPHFAEAASRCWDYIQAHFIDREHGEWFKMVRRDGAPDLSHYKTGPWECPYHNARMCFEMLRRLE